MSPISAGRARWLRVVHSLTSELRRPPNPADVARRLGIVDHAARTQTSRALRDGHLVPTRRATAFAPTPLRVSPLALAEIGLPMVTYLAWPGTDPGRGSAVAEWLGRLGLWAVSPHLGHHRREPGSEVTLAEVAALLACRADAVVVWADALLLGRSDVAAALAAGVPISLVRRCDDPAVRTSSDLWRPPCLVPVDPQPSARR